MTDAPELKPCPFCGGGARIYQDPSHSTAWFCGCEDWDCFGNMMWDETKTGATDKWNRRADLSSPLGAVAMRDVASAVVAGMAPFYIGETRFADHADLTKQIANIPTPDHAGLLAHAMRLPEVAALRKALHFYADFHGNPNDGPWGINSDDFGEVARTALEAKP